jgi:hypothetical protein
MPNIADLNLMTFLYQSPDVSKQQALGRIGKLADLTLACQATWEM